MYTFRIADENLIVNRCSSWTALILSVERAPGGIIALALMAGFELKLIENLYEELPSVIFSKGPSNWGRYLWSGGDTYYDPKPLEAVLKKFFGKLTFADIAKGPKCFQLA